MVIGLVSQKYLHLLVLHFPPLVVTTNPGGGETGLIQTVVAASVCSVPGLNTVDDWDSGYSMVAAAGGALQTPAGSALRIAPC